MPNLPNLVQAKALSYPTPSIDEIEVPPTYELESHWALDVPEVERNFRRKHFDCHS